MGDLPDYRHAHAQRREREYSPSKLSHDAHVVGGKVAAPLNEGSGNIPPPRLAELARLSAFVVALNEGSGNIPPPRRARLALGPARAPPLNEGSGNIPPPSRSTIRRTTPCRRRAQRREREYSPSKCFISCEGGPGFIVAQRREREYSPSKGRVRRPGGRSGCARSTKGAGIFPLQAAHAQRRAPLRRGRSTKGAGIFPLQDGGPAYSVTRPDHAQRREREYSPSKCFGQADDAALSIALNEGSGNIPPPRRKLAQRYRPDAPPLNEGSGNIPPPRTGCPVVVDVMP